MAIIVYLTLWPLALLEYRWRAKVPPEIRLLTRNRGSFVLVRLVSSRLLPPAPGCALALPTIGFWPLP